MKTVIYINHCGRIIQITDDAWKNYKAYIEALHIYFLKEQNHFEIINDIESRIAELFQEELNRKCSFIDEQDVQSVVMRIGTVAAFEEWDNDEWEMPVFASKQHNTANKINAAKPVFFLTETNVRS